MNISIVVCNCSYFFTAVIFTTIIRDISGHKSFVCTT